MDEPNRPVRDGDRKPVRDRIKRAVAEGRIGSADGDIRLRNVDSAQSMGELGMIARDLDQLEATIAPHPVGPVVPTATIPAAPTSRGRGVVVAAVIAVVVLVGLGAVGLFAIRSGGSTYTGSTEVLGEASPIAEPTVSASPKPSPPAAPAYSLSAAGIRTFLQTYRERFGTTRAIAATFYGDYVVVQVPAGGKRHSGWVYRPASGFSDFGGVSANFPGSAAVDLARLDVAALMKNVVRAKRVLRVEDANQTYVNIDYRPQFDPVPNVNIYLSNKFNESGYLATTLGGKVERTYPFNAG